MQMNLQKQQRKTSLNYLIVKSSIFGIAINVIFIDKNIAKAERTPKRIVGLKFDKTKIKNPKIIVDPMLKNVDETIAGIISKKQNGLNIPPVK